MATPSFWISTYAFLIVMVMLSMSLVDIRAAPIVVVNDADTIQFALNLEFFEAEFFLNGALGQGLDAIAANLSQRGPPPIGARKANLDSLSSRIMEEFAYQEVGHLRAIISRVGGFSRPLLDLSSSNFGNILYQAIGHPLVPPFDPYFNTINFLLAAYLVPYVGLVGYVGAIPFLNSSDSRSLAASLLGVEAGQDAVIRSLLYQKADQKVYPYNFTVAYCTSKISDLRNRLAKSGNKDEGLVVPLQLGAENRTSSNILSADANSLSYARSPVEILRFLYGTGNESKPGGFFPIGANGKIARSLLDH